MLKHHQNKIIMSSVAAFAVGLAGAITTYLTSQKKSKTLSSQAKKVAQDMMEGIKGWNWTHGERLNKNLFIGSIAGSVLGATAAVLLAPKSGKELIGNFIKLFQSHLDSKAEVKKVGKVVKKTSKAVKHAATSSSKVVRRAAAKTVHAKKRPAVHAKSKKAPVKKGHK